MYHCRLPADILIYMYFDEAIQDINETVLLKDCLTVLLDADVKCSDLTGAQCQELVRRLRFRGVKKS